MEGWICVIKVNKLKKGVGGWVEGTPAVKRKVRVSRRQEEQVDKKWNMWGMW